MSDIAHRTARAFRSWLSDRRYRAGYRLAQWWPAWRYAVDRLSADDAQRMMLDCRDPAGWHPLLVLKTRSNRHARPLPIIPISRA